MNIPQFDTIEEFDHQRYTIEHTTQAFWNCAECGQLFPKSIEECPDCECKHYESPDACVYEVIDELRNGTEDVRIVNMLIHILLKWEWKFYVGEMVTVVATPEQLESIGIDPYYRDYLGYTFTITDMIYENGEMWYEDKDYGLLFKESFLVKGE